jgi:uncharacterized protein YecE (DUF72 family)
MTGIESSHINIGTSGIVVPGNKASFPIEYQSSSRLHYYASLFNTLEINSSFYKIPLPATFTKWAADVSDKFTFTVKLWRGITHAKRLEYSNADIKRFMQAANFLENKAGCLLIQFPASINADFTHKVEAILDQLCKLNTEQQWQLAVEFRHPSWYQALTYKLLDQYQATQVIHDMPGSKTPIDYEPKQLAYVRFHGPTGNYNGSYSDDFITHYAKQIKSWRTQGKEIYIYFNNTIGGALQNAQHLQSLV